MDDGEDSKHILLAIEHARNGFQTSDTIIEAAI